MNKRLLILVGILAIATVILAVFYFFTNKKTNSPKQEEKPPVSINTLQEDQIPSGFPKDIPIEQGSETKQSYEATSLDGRKQSTFSTTTNKTLSQAVAVYKEFFMNLGWVEVGQSDKTAEMTRTSLRRNNDFLTIEALLNTESDVKTVDITLIESGK